MSDKISAMCVSLCRRQLTDAWRDYNLQTHENKEMILVIQQMASALPDEILKDPTVRIVIGDKDATLGELRNLAREKATGDYIMQWDDDDRYSPWRMVKQLALHKKAFKESDPLTGASLIDNFLLLGKEKLFWIDRSGNGKPGSILFGKNCPFSYPCEKRGEDQVVVNQLHKRRLLRVISTGIIYLRTYHGENTWDYQHFQGLLKRQMPEDVVRAFASDIREAYEGFRVGHGAILTSYGKEIGSL